MFFFFRSSSIPRVQGEGGVHELVGCVSLSEIFQRAHDSAICCPRRSESSTIHLFTSVPGEAARPLPRLFLFQCLLLSGESLGLVSAELASGRAVF